MTKTTSDARAASLLTLAYWFKSADSPAAVLLAVWLILISYNVTLASIGSSHTCSSADGEFTIDFMSQDEGKLLHRGSEIKQPFTVVKKILIERTTKICKSQSSNKMLYQYKIREERYIMEVDAASYGKMFVYCEFYVDPSPASACDSNYHDKIVEHKELVPRYK